MTATHFLASELNGVADPSPSSSTAIVAVDASTTSQPVPLERKVPPSPPVPGDFSRITTRFMLAAREWARAKPERAVDALKRSVIAWGGLLAFTVWRWADRPSSPKGGIAAAPGWGNEHVMTIDCYAAKLAEAAAMLAPKGKLACVSLGRSRYRGSFDEECLERTGIFFDSDDCGGWDESRGLLRSVVLAFAAQRRPARPLSHHLEIPLAKPWIPERNADGTIAASWKSEVYCPQLGWILGVFSELANLRYEPAWDVSGHATAKHAGYDTTCDRLLQLNYIYHRRPGDPPDHEPATDHAAGGALDIGRLLELTDFGAANGLLSRGRLELTRQRFAIPKRPLQVERVSDVALLVRLRRLRRPESLRLIGRLLAGESYAPLGQRNAEMHRAASIIAALAPAEDAEHLAKLIFEKSLVTMSALPGAESTERYVDTYLALAARRIQRAQRRILGGAR
jgi:hypothetical protein